MLRRQLFQLGEIFFGLGELFFADEVCGVLHEHGQGGLGIMNEPVPGVSDPNQDEGQQEKCGEPAQVEPAEPWHRRVPVKTHNPSPQQAKTNLV